MNTLVNELDNETFNSFIKDNFTLIDVYATWCGPCKQISPILDEVSLELKDTLKIGKLDADKNRDTISTLNVRSVPTLLLYKNNEIVERHTGGITKETLTNLIKKHS